MTDDGFASSFHQYFSETVVSLIVMGASRADAEEIAQEAMILAWRQWDKLHKPKAWIGTVAARAYWDLHRTRPPTVSLDGFVPESVIDSDLSIFAEQQQRVLRLLRALPFMQRIVIALVYDGWTCKEIAETLQILEPTVRSHLRHARRNLKGMMLSARLPGFEPPL